MKELYKIYKASDLLADDYFIETMLNPTEESEKFWNSLIRENNIDHAEFISAYTMIRSINRNKPGVPEERIDNLWQRISATNEERKPSRGRKRAKVASLLSMAAAAAVALVVTIVMKDRPENGLQAIDNIYESILENTALPEKIELVSGDRTVELEGHEVNVEVESSGTVKVNNTKVDMSVADEVVMSSLRVPYARRANLKLPDGTMLWLNSGSTVVYPTTFTGDKREIYLEGEIYAQVARYEAMPFIIRTKDLAVKVLGTSFNISAYRDEAHTDVVLVEGSVSVSPPSGEEKVLAPGQRLMYAGGETTVRTVNVDKYISWRDGIYIFTNEPIENILSRLSKYYNIRMDMPATVSGITCSGKLVLRDELDHLLSGLSEITPMRYVLADNECFIRFDNRTIEY